MILKGNFFKLSSLSEIEKDVVFFRYLCFKVMDNFSDEVYPIYVTLNTNNIKFYIEYNKKEEFPLHYLIFSLPISSNKVIRDDLGDELISIYDRTDENISLEEAKISNFSTYFIKRKNKSNTRKDLAILFLDFLYDFEFSNIFKYSSCYEQVEIGLKENLFFQALLAKYKYLYYRDLPKSPKNDLINNELKKAKDNWLRIIMLPEAEKIIKEDNKWFEDIETEHLKVLELWTL